MDLSELMIKFSWGGRKRGVGIFFEKFKRVGTLIRDCRVVMHYGCIDNYKVKQALVYFEQMKNLRSLTKSRLWKASVLKLPCLTSAEQSESSCS